MPQITLSRRTWILVVFATAVVTGAAFMGWQSARAWFAWNSVERVEFDTDVAREQLQQLEDVPQTAPPTTVPEAEPGPSYLSVLVIGSDSRESPDRDFEFADAVMLYLVPDDGSGPVTVSFPRDTALMDPCAGEESKITLLLTPCETFVSAPEHVALAMEDLTGIPIDHFALVDFEVFATAVDLVDGVEVCTEYAMREGGYEIKPAGCAVLDGEHALAFVRSRATQVFVDDEWVFLDEMVGDTARVSRHRLLLLALLDELSQMRTPGDLASMVEHLGDGLLLSETLGLGDAVALAWDLRSSASIRSLTLPTEGSTLPDGVTYAARPTITVKKLLEGSQ